MNGEWFAHHQRRVVTASLPLIERDQVHVANTGYDRITFAAINHRQFARCLLARVVVICLLAFPLLD